MTKVKFLLPSKAVVLFLLFILFTAEAAWTQCTNPTPTGDNNQTFCKIDQPTITNLTVTGGTIHWYDAAVGGVQYFDSQQLEDGKTYYAEDVTNGDCSPSRLAVSVAINGQEPDNVNVFVGICAIEQPTISQLSADGQNIEWYTESTGGTLLDASHFLENGKTYWVQQTYNGCTSRRLPTSVNLIDADAPVVNPVQNFCTEGIITIASLTPSGTNIIWYSSETATDPLDATEPLVHGEDYWAATVTFPCESTVRTPTTISIETPPDAGGNGALLFCELDPVVENLFDLLTDNPDTTGTWSGPSMLSNGYLGTFDAATNIEGTYTYTVSTGTGICPDASSTVSVTIQKTPPPTISEVNQTFCEIDAPTIANLVASGTSLVWFDTEMSTIPLNATDALVDGEDYWAAEVNTGTGCISAIRVVVNVTITTIPPPTVSNVNQTFCSIDTPTIADLAVTGTTIVWFDTELSTTPLTSTDALIDGEDYWAAETGANGCQSATRVVVNTSITDVPAPTTTSTNQDFCLVDQPTIADIQVNEIDIVWYDAENGGNVLTTDIALTDGASYWAAQTSNGCESPNRLEITTTVNDIVPPTTPNNAQTFCDIDNPTIADIQATGTNIVWFDTETSTTALNASDALVDGATYWAAQTDAASGCISSTRIAISVTITTVPPPTVSATSQTFCSIDTPTIADIAVTGTTIVWFDTELSTTPLTSTDALIDGEDYWAAETGANGCQSATRVVVNTSITDVPTPTTTSTNQDFCLVDQPTIADIQVNEIDIVWYDAENGGNVLTTDIALTDGASYWAAQTSNGCESPNRLEITTTVNDIVPPTTPNNAQTFCDIDNPTIADIQATGTNIVWFDTETSTAALNASDVLVDGATYWAAQTDAASGCISSTRIAISVTITTVPPPTVSATSQTFCSIDTPTIADLAVTGTTIVWFDTELSTTPLTSTDALIDGEDYWAAESGANGCLSATRVVVNTTVIDVAPPTTTNANQAFCVIDQPTVADLQVNEASIVWYDAMSGGTIVDPTTDLTDGTSYWAALQGNGCESPTRLEITVTLNDIPAPTTTNVSQTFCELENATIADLDITGTNIVWFDTETSTTALNASDALLDGATYWAAQTDGASGCISATRIAISVTITTVPPPTVSNVNQTFCSIDTPTIADLAATGTTIVWFDTELSTTPLTSTDTLIDGEDYWAAESGANGCLSATRVVVNTTVIDVAPPTTTNANQAFCVIDQPTVADLQVNEASIVWYDAMSGGTIVDPTTDLTDGTSYWAALQGNGCESPTRLEITVTLNDIPAPTTTNVSQTFCELENATIADIDITGTNIVWFDTETSTTALNASDALVDGATYWAAQTDGASGCISSTRIAISVTITTVTPPTVINVNQTFCSIDTPTIADLAVNGTTIVWFDTELSTTPLTSTDALVDGEDYWAAESGANGCLSATRVVVNTTVIDVDSPTTANPNQEFCAVDQPTISDLQVNEASIVWYDAATGGNSLAQTTSLTDGLSYWAAHVVNGCESPVRLEVTATINDIAAPTTPNTTQSHCELDSQTIADLIVNETNIVWYASQTSTTALNITDVLSSGTYWAAQIDTTTGCESSSRLAVSVVITNSTPPTTANTLQLFCSIDNPTIANLQTIETDVYWYANENDSTPIDATEALIDGARYYGSFFNAPSPCEGPTRLAITVSISNPPAPTTSNTTMTFCAVDAPTVAELTLNESEVLWFSSDVETTPLADDTLLVNGAEYWAAQSDVSTGCIGTSRLKITVNLTDPGMPNISAQGQDFCMIDEPTIADLVDRINVSSGSSVEIMDAPDGFALNSGNMLINGTTYYAKLRDASGCLGMNTLAITVDLNQCDAYDVKFFDGFSPNGDGVNESYNILYIKELYPDFEVRFFNRWGAEVYYMNASTPGWNGRLHGDGALVPSGVYFYVAEFKKDGRKPVQGRLILNR